MNATKAMTLLLATLLFGEAWGEEETEPTVGVSNVVARQRYPWNGLVDIECDVSCSDAQANLFLLVTGRDNSAGKRLAARHVWFENDATHTNTLAVKAGHHRLVWDAGVDYPNVVSTNVTIEVQAFDEGVQLWENGPYWAECNVGASKPEEYGYYFWWGDTVGYRYVSGVGNSVWISVMDGSCFYLISRNCSTYGKDFSQLKSKGYIDAKCHLMAAYDAATVHLGAPWRMPTSDEFGSLIRNCTTTWTKRNGVYGYLVAGNGAYSSRSIFLPAAGSGYDDHRLYGDVGNYGSYWSSDPERPLNPEIYASKLYFCSSFYSSNFIRSDAPRYYGMSVRPVRDCAK